MAVTRWSKEREIQEALVPSTDKSAGGPVLHYDRNVRYVNVGEGHILYMGVSGVGKTRRGIYPMIRSQIRAKESVVVVDPKGEIFRNTACYAEGSHEIVVIDLRHPLNTLRFNPLELVRVYYKEYGEEERALAYDILDELAKSLYPTANHQDPFWILSARSLFMGLVYFLMDNCSPEQVNIHNVFRCISEGEERFGASNYLKELVKLMDPDDLPAMLLYSYANTADDTKAGIRSVMMEGIANFGRSEAVKNFSSGSDFRICDIKGDRPMAIYVILPDDTSAYDTLAGILINQLVKHYIRLADTVYEGKLPVRLNVCLEELGNIGQALEGLPHLMSAGRSRNVRLAMVLQSLSQLEDIYGKAKMDTILGNVSTMVTFRVNHFLTLEEMSRRCGEKADEEDGMIRKEALITTSELGALKLGQALIMIDGRAKYVEEFPDYTEQFDCSGLYIPDYRKSGRKPGEKTPSFSLKEFVREKKAAGTPGMVNSSPARPAEKTESPFGSERDIDEIIASIDRQIKALEEEEKRNKEEEQKAQKEKEEQQRKEKEEQLRKEQEEEQRKEKEEQRRERLEEKWRKDQEARRRREQARRNFFFREKKNKDGGDDGDDGDDGELPF